MAKTALILTPIKGNDLDGYLDVKIGLQALGYEVTEKTYEEYIQQPIEKEFDLAFAGRFRRCSVRVTENINRKSKIKSI